MKKKIIVAMIVLIVIIVIYMNYNQVSSLSFSFEGITNIYRDKVIFISNENIFEFEKTDYLMIIDYKYINDKTIQVYLNKAKNIIGFNNLDKFYTIEEKFSKEILSLDVFNLIYEYNSVPKISFLVNDEEINIAANEFLWSYKLLNGEFNSEIIENTEIKKINIDKNSSLEIFCDIEPQKISVKKSTGEELFLTSNHFDFENIEENIVYTILFEWNNDEYSGIAEYEIEVFVDLPIEVIVSENEVYQGDYITLYLNNVNNYENIKIEQSIANKIDIWEINDGHIAIVPINYWVNEGNYEIIIDSDELDYPIEILLKVNKKDFNIQYLYIDKEIEESTRNDEAYEEYAFYMNPARAVSRETAIFEGMFIQPVEGRISTEFGVYRYVNDNLTSYRHSGIDIAIDKGTPIKATNNGYVNLARNLILTGSTIVIDHGLGIFSVYLHMDSLNVGKDQFVSKGEIIGEVGTTGFSTGPHLHWTMSYYKTNLNPYFFMENLIFNDIK